MGVKRKFSGNYSKVKRRKQLYFKKKFRSFSRRKTSFRRNMPRITGSGSYKIKYNSLAGNDPPMMHDHVSTIRIRHREYIGDVITHTSTNTFKVDSYSLTPSDPTTFPWASKIAVNYQEWQPLGIMLEFKSMAADALNSVNIALGSVTLTTQYNANTSAPKDKSTMENTDYTTSAKPSVSQQHYVECDPKQSPMQTLYVPQKGDISGDGRFTNWGKFFIATTGFQGTNVNIGELWISYDILLSKPFLLGTRAGETDHYILGTSGITTSDTFHGATWDTINTSNLKAFTTLGTNIIQLPKQSGNYMITYLVFGSAGSLVDPTLTLSNGVTQLKILNNGTGFEDGTGGEGGTDANYRLIFFVNAVPLGDSSVPTITLSGGTLPGSPSGGDLFITAI